jgi:hypothetical protein
VSIICTAVSLVFGITLTINEIRPTSARTTRRSRQAEKRWSAAMNRTLNHEEEGTNCRIASFADLRILQFGKRG